MILIVNLNTKNKSQWLLSQNPSINTFENLDLYRPLQAMFLSLNALGIDGW